MTTVRGGKSCWYSEALKGGDKEALGKDDSEKVGQYLCCTADV